MGVVVQPADVGFPVLSDQDEADLGVRTRRRPQTRVHAHYVEGVVGDIVVN
ncbi:hypothetical protein DPMN_025162 [Dreissena polymorpha]|uniref:Uncharacterized protein n=1 Tax=Dreissena polymorpha TaxID=45954 RepID=A0A9D4LSS3_DREPO|nr:hypothetical protein DPMN_025162 [Dreissena polymorpha]